MRSEAAAARQAQGSTKAPHPVACSLTTVTILLYCSVIVERELRRRNASRRLLSALLANEQEEAESLLALGVPLKAPAGREVHGSRCSCPLQLLEHAANVSNGGKEGGLFYGQL